jgi:hypothetical protein
MYTSQPPVGGCDFLLLLLLLLLQKGVWKRAACSAAPSWRIAAGG